MSENTQKTTRQGLSSLSKSTIWMLSFGFLDVQTAFTLQSSQMSRVFQTLGTDPHSLGRFFVLSSLAGMLVQPIVGYCSSRTWKSRLGGRRLPYLLYDTLIAVVVMTLMPNSGSFGFGYVPLTALSFGMLMIALLDASSSMATQPFKMTVGDTVNEEQKSYAYGAQSFLANTGAAVTAVLPFVFAHISLASMAKKGVVPQTVVVVFYMGAALLVTTSAFTIFKVKEYDPETYARYHGIDVAVNQEKANWFELLKTAPKVFWTVTLVQSFCWFTFQYTWTYSAGATTKNVWHVTDASSVGYQEAGNWYGVLVVVQSVVAVVCSLVLAKVPSQYHKTGHFSCLVLGALDFFSVFFISNQYVLASLCTLIGIAWVGIITYSLMIVTNALPGKHMGTYLGLFNGSICMPQTVTLLLSFVLFPMLGGLQAGMFLAAGVVPLLGVFSVSLIKETHGRVWAMSDTFATRDSGLLGGWAITGYVLLNRRGARVCVLGLGGIVQELSVLVDGMRENPVVPFDDAASYADNPFQINKQIGHVAGHIYGVVFDISGRTYRVEANEGRNALHGGSHGLAAARSDAVTADGRLVALRSRPQQSADGYPNDLDLDISYRLDKNDRLTVTYRTTAFGDTVFGPTLRIYWRLGAGLHDAVLYIPQGRHIPADAEKLSVSTVSDGFEVLDFSRPKPLDVAVAALYRETGWAGLDDAYCVPPDIGRPATVLQAGRRRISIYSDRNGPVIFTAAPQDFARHDVGVYDALATEAQTLPDSLHWPEFGNIRLNKGDIREAMIAYGTEPLSQELPNTGFKQPFWDFTIPLSQSKQEPYDAYKNHGNQPLDAAFGKTGKRTQTAAREPDQLGQRLHGYAR